MVACLLTRRQALCFLGLLCFASAAGAQDATPVRSLLEIRQKNVVVQQWDTSCGAAALATLLKYQHGLDVSEKQIAEAMLRTGDALKVKVRGGFSLLDLKRYADARGLEGVGYLQLGLDDLVAMAPAIVPITTRGYPHFVVVRGRAGDKLLIADPAFGNRTMDVDAFESAWTQNIGFVVRRRDGLVPPNQLMKSSTDTLRPSDAAVRSALR
jgi:predicted double-glycine peptidase